MPRKRTPFHFTTTGVEIRIDDTESRPGLMDALSLLMDRLTGRAEREPPSLPENMRVMSLTQREREVARLICEGLTSKAIADKLCVEMSTIRAHRRSISRKLGVSSRAGLLAARETWERD